MPNENLFFEKVKMIDFQVGNVDMPALDADKVWTWLCAVAASHGYQLSKVSYRFCNDEEILEANRQFVGHDYYTDIITFDYTRGDRAAGDILISLDTVASNASGMGIPFATELRRVIAHGVLHLCGINDKSPEERAVMEKAENDALALWNSMFEN